jgi:ribosomal protein S18 acetylase RimI-like enzyme
MTWDNRQETGPASGWRHRLVELFGDWRFFFQRDGWRSATSVAIRELRGLPYRHMQLLVLARPLWTPLPEYDPKMELSIRRFELADVPSVNQINRPSEAGLCALRLSRGQRGFSAFHGDQLAGYAWADDRLDPTLERVQFPLLPGDGVCLDFYTAPAFREQGVQTALTSALLRDLRELGYDRALAYIEKGNLPSLAVWQRKFEGDTIGMIDFVRVGPWRRTKIIDTQG